MIFLLKSYNGMLYTNILTYHAAWYHVIRGALYGAIIITSFLPDFYTYVKTLHKTKRELDFTSMYKLLCRGAMVHSLSIIILFNIKNYSGHY